MSVKKRSNAEWRELIAQWEASGQTQEEWCLLHSVNLYTMRDRARRLRKMDSEGSAGPMIRPTERSGWVEVQESSDETKSNELCRSEIRIAAGAFSISVTDGFNVETLKRVLSLITGVS